MVVTEGWFIFHAFWSCTLSWHAEHSVIRFSSEAAAELAPELARVSFSWKLILDHVLRRWARKNVGVESRASVALDAVFVCVMVVDAISRRQSIQSAVLVLYWCH